MGIVYVWEDDFPTEEEYQNAYKRGLSVMKVMGGEKEYVEAEHFLNLGTHEPVVITYKMTYELAKLSILHSMGNREWLSATSYIDVKEIYNVTENINITDDSDIPKRFIEDFQDNLYHKLNQYFRIYTDFEMIYNIGPYSKKKYKLIPQP